MSLIVSESMGEGIARLAINRPERRNALSPDARLELIAALDAALGDSAVKAIVFGSTVMVFTLTGASAFFSVDA